MLYRQKSRRDDPNSGFSLVELLVVVAILAILIMIAIPLFLNQKAKAQTATLRSDIHNMAMEMEGLRPPSGSYITAYPSTTMNTLVTNSGWKKSNGWTSVDAFTDCAYSAKGGTTLVSSPGNYVIRGYIPFDSTDRFVYDSMWGEWRSVKAHGVPAGWTDLDTAYTATTCIKIGQW